MEQNTLEAIKRNDLGKGAAGRLRREGQIPAIVYGHNEPVSIAVPAKEFEKKFHSLSESTIITLKIEGKECDVLIKDYQENVMKGQITHLDFFEIERGKKLRTNVPLHAVGTAPGVKEGGILEMGLHEVEIECLPKDIPSELSISIEGMAIGDSKHVADIDVPQGVVVITGGDMMAAAITTQKVVSEEEEGEANAEAEVIGEAAATEE